MAAGGSGRREPMSKVDTAWLRMEQPTNLMMITGVLMFERRLSLKKLRKLIDERFLAFPRFRQKAVQSPSGAYWETDRHFDLDWHLHRTALPGAGDQAELERLVSQLASTPLDHSKPLWQFHLVENYRGGSALISRIHHCYADGIALIQVLLSLTDTTAEAKQGTDLPHAWLKDDGARITRTFFGTQLDRAVKLGGRMFEKSVEMYRDPSLAGVLAREGGEVARELAYAISLPDDPPTALKGELGVTKRCAWAEPLPLEEVKTVGRALGCTVNDVLLASAAGALRAYLLEQGEQVDGLTIRATVPVNLRPLAHAKKLGNHFGLVFLELPVGEPNPLARLERVAGCMRELKNARQAMVTFGLLAVVGMLPAAMQRIALELFSRKASTVATNVPGPQMTLYLAGCAVRELMFWVPQSGSIGMGISILSYNGNVHFGLITDRKRVPEPEQIIRRFRSEFEKLLYITLLEDWEQPITAADAAASLAYLQAAGIASKTGSKPPARQTRRAKGAHATQKTAVARRSPDPGAAEAASAAPAREASSRAGVSRKANGARREKPSRKRAKQTTAAAQTTGEFSRRLAAFLERSE